MPITTLTLGNQTARLQDGELIAYLVDTHEFIHQKGSPGWRSSDTEMFPIIGPTAEAGFSVSTPKGPATQDQHGLLRELPYSLVESTETSVTFEVSYVTGTSVPNSKYPGKSTAQHLSWPYSFRFRKTAELTAAGLRIAFEVNGDAGMPFMLGYHPAFKLTTDAPTIVAGNRTVALADILAVGDRALKLADTTELVLQDARALRIQTEGFGHFMCWTKVPNMVCLEPITYYPYDAPQAELAQEFMQLGSEPRVFSVLLTQQD